MIRDARERGVHPGYALGRDYEGMDDVLLVAVTEKRTAGGRRPARRRPRGGVLMSRARSAWRDDAAHLRALRAGRRAGRLPDYGLADARASDTSFAARVAPRLPELAESEIVRHITALADRTFGVDTGFYPLGSCTMKHNPRVNERVGRLPGFRDLHPHAGGRGRAGRARAHVAPAGDPRGDRRASLP